MGKAAAAKTRVATKKKGGMTLDLPDRTEIMNMRLQHARQVKRRTLARDGGAQYKKDIARANLKALSSDAKWVGTSKALASFRGELEANTLIQGRKMFVSQPNDAARLLTLLAAAASGPGGNVLAEAELAKLVAKGPAGVKGLVSDNTLDTLIERTLLSADRSLYFEATITAFAERGASVKTVRNAISAMNSFITHSIDHGFLRKSEAKRKDLGAAVGAAVKQFLRLAKTNTALRQPSVAFFLFSLFPSPSTLLCS
jgi:hypothetical protein